MEAKSGAEVKQIADIKIFLTSWFKVQVTFIREIIGIFGPIIGIFAMVIYLILRVALTYRKNKNCENSWGSSHGCASEVICDKHRSELV